VARDAAGNKTTSAAVPVTVANATPTPPAVWLSTPSNGAVVAGKTTVTANASGSLPVTALQVLVDGKLLGQGTHAPYSLTWDTTSVANGSHRLSAVLRDTEGNATLSAAVTVTVRNTTTTQPPDLAPAISRLKLSSASFRKSATISFRLSEAAKVTLSFERKLRGHKRRGKCSASTKRGARCTLYRRAGSKIKVDASAGVNTLRLGRRGMPAGSYRLTLVAVDSTGKHSPAMRTGFHLIGAAPHSTRAPVVEAAIRSVLLAF
jgi:hypothetical protein